MGDWAAPHEPTRVSLFNNVQIMNRTYLLRLSNYERFIAEYTNTGAYYETPHSILSELEKAVCFKETIEDCLLIAYKEWGDIIFRFSKTIHDGRNVYVVYEYDTSIS